MRSEFEEEIIDKVLEVAQGGKAKLLLWGCNDSCLSILRALKRNQRLVLVSGIIDDASAGKVIFGIEILNHKSLKDLDFDTLVITVDSEKEAALIKFRDSDDRTPKVILAGSEHMKFSDPLFYEVLASCPVKSKASGYPNMLIHVYQSLLYLSLRKLGGTVVEFGVCRGGTTAFIAKTLHKLGVKERIIGFDTFEGFPPRKSVLDQFDEPESEYSDYQSVRNYLEPLGVELVKGDIVSTYKILDRVPLMFSFFDTDNYSPTRAALELCYNQTVPGGILAFDHFYCDERWVNTIGERIAVEEILRGKNVLNLHGTGIFMKF